MKTSNYKGYELRTFPEKTHSHTLIYKDDEPIGGTFATPSENFDSIGKAKTKIDNYKGK